MTNPGPIWFDRDVAEFFGISRDTLRRRLRHPVVGELNLGGAEPVTVGGRRIWTRERVEALVGLNRGNNNRNNNKERQR